MMADALLAPAIACAEWFYQRIFREWPEAVTREIDGCTLSYSGDPRLTGANHIWPHTPDALREDVLIGAARFFGDFQAAWSVVLTDTFMPQGLEALNDRGFFWRWSSPLLVLDGPPTRMRTHPGVDVIRATTPQHVADIGRVMAEAFASSNSVNARVGRAEHLTADDIAHYLIYCGAEPAACATVALYGGMAGIWNVGTRYRFRRQRFATTIMLAVLDDLLHRGITTSMLMASSAGRPLYDRLGYRQIGTTIYFGPPHVYTIAYGRA